MSDLELQTISFVFEDEQDPDQLAEKIRDIDDSLEEDTETFDLESDVLREAFEEEFGEMVILENEEINVSISPDSIGLSKSKIEEFSEEIESLLDSEDIDYEKENGYALKLDSLEEFFRKDIEEEIGDITGIISVSGEDESLMLEFDDENNVLVKGEKEVLKELD